MSEPKTVKELIAKLEAEGKLDPSHFEIVSLLASAVSDPNSAYWQLKSPQWGAKVEHTPIAEQVYQALLRISTSYHSTREQRLDIVRNIFGHGIVSEVQALIHRRDLEDLQQTKLH